MAPADALGGRDKSTLAHVLQPLRDDAFVHIVRRRQIVLALDGLSEREAALDERGLEGIVSKKADQPYVSGKNRGWVKVKCHAWREANADRGEFISEMTGSGYSGNIVGRVPASRI